MTDLGDVPSVGVSSSSSWRYLPSMSAKSSAAADSSVSLLLQFWQDNLQKSLTCVPSSFSLLHRFLFTAHRGVSRNTSQVRVSPFLLITTR